METLHHSHYPNYRYWLEAELLKRCDKNQKYSLRAFARSLELSPALLSKILSGKSLLTLKTGEKIASSLSLSPEERDSFFKLVIQDQRQRIHHLKNKVLSQKDSQEGFQILTTDAFKAISDWYHYAICELTYLKSFKNDPRWISKMLGITPIEAKTALARLERLGILKKNSKGQLFKAMEKTTTTRDLSSSALKHFHRQILEKAMQSLQDHAVEERDMTSITMAIDPKDMAIAKKEIRNFRRRLCHKFTQAKQRQVYTLAIQFFPLSKKEEVKRI